MKVIISELALFVLYVYVFLIRKFSTRCHYLPHYNYI